MRFERRWLKRLKYDAMDRIDSLLGKRGPFDPPRRIWFEGSEQFHAIGREFFGYFKELGGLKPGEHVLDVGCGAGRMAIPLMEYLGPQGSYDGFDIVPDGTAWCREAITSRAPNFRFAHSDIYNKSYNPAGKVKASEYRFPYPDATFDFVFLTSVFTHLLPPDLEHYLSEIHRVMKPGGRCLITYFLLTDESRRLLDAGKGTLAFLPETNGYRVVSLEEPESAIAFDQAYIESLYKKLGFREVGPARYGSWCGRAEHLSYQDILVAAK